MRWISFLLVMIIAAACGSSGSEETVESTVGDPITVTPAPPAERATAPAPVDGNFREDPAELVANTGRPQLVEVFSYD
jgi:hypothetical protein